MILAGEKNTLHREWECWFNGLVDENDRAWLVHRWKERKSLGRCCLLLDLGWMDG